MKKNLFLVGGSYGIGLSIVKTLSRDHNIYVASRTGEGLQDYGVRHIPFDVQSDHLDLSALPTTIHGFVYCPGTINLKPFKMLSLDNFREEMELNFFSLVKVTKSILPKMAEDSSMVFFSTIAVGSGMPFHSSIAAAKGAVEGFAKSLAAEYAPKIRVNCIAPSLVETPLSKRLLNNDRKRDIMANRHPLKRFGKPIDIANTASFLLKEESAWITGQVFGIDGGLSSLNLN